ncbi:MAG: hypothetical protein KJZ57_10865, partial [Anaerolineales bacterium]|nr:hypothetical protein [Anaerolineales bacterium]
MPFYIDPLSFGIGAVFGILASFLAARMRPAFREWRAGMAVRREEARARRSTGIEDNLRRVTLRRAQGMHLAAPLFALDEIILTPKFIAPPPRVEPGASPPPEDIVSRTLPYLPSWPELASLYRAPSLTLPQALSGGSNIAVVGAYGLGKTVALAHLATLSANRDPQLGALADRVPFLVHVADLSLPVDNPQNILNPIIDAEAERTSFLEVGRMASFAQYIFKSGRALLLL